MIGVVTAMLALWLLAELARDWVAKHRCGYCGVVAGHDPGCPYSLAE